MKSAFIAFMLWFPLGAMAQNTNPLLDSLKAASERLSYYPDSIDLRLRKAAWYVLLEEWQSAKNEYDIVLRHYPANIAALYYRAYCNDRLGRYNFARLDYQNLLTLVPGNFEARLGLALLNEKDKHYTEALDGIIAADGSEIVNSANRTANLDSFEFLFRYNNALMRFNLVLSLGSLAMGASKVEIGGFQENYEMMFSGAKASISAAKSLADALKMRYDNYDFIFEYASGDYDDVMEKYKEFTKSNITSTASTVVDMFTGALADAVGNEEYEFITKVWDTVSESWTLLQSAAKRESLTDEDAEALWNLFDRFT